MTLEERLVRLERRVFVLRACFLGAALSLVLVGTLGVSEGKGPSVRVMEEDAVGIRTLIAQEIVLVDSITADKPKTRVKLSGVPAAIALFGDSDQVEVSLVAGLRKDVSGLFVSREGRGVASVVVDESAPYIAVQREEWGAKMISGADGGLVSVHDRAGRVRGIMGMTAEGPVLEAVDASGKRLRR